MNTSPSISDRTPLRLTEVSLAFSFVNFLVHGVNSQTTLAFLVFTAVVYLSGKIAVLLGSPALKMTPEVEALKLPLSTLFALLLIIATFSYSWLFGAFYGAVLVIYLISPYDRDWILGASKVVIVGSKIEYRKEM